MATTDVIFTGFYYAIGYTLTVSIAGIDCGDHVVDSKGRVTVPINSDTNVPPLFNGAYLAQFDVGPYDHTTYGDATTQVTMSDGVGGIQTMYLPVVIGFLYPAWGIPLRPVSEAALKARQGPSTGTTKRAYWFSALLLNTQGVSFGGNSGIYDKAVLADDGGNVLPTTQLWSGVLSKPVDDNPNFDGVVGWQSFRPYPCTVCSMTTFIDTAER